MSNLLQILLYFASAILLTAALATTWTAISRLRATTAAYNARLLPFAHYSLVSWALLLVSYVALGILEAQRIRSDVFTPTWQPPSPLNIILENAVLAIGLLSSAFLGLAVLALYSRRPQRPAGRITVAVALWIAVVTLLLTASPYERSPYWLVALALDAVLFWSFIPAVLRLRLGWRYALPFGVYGALQLPWAVVHYASNTWTVFVVSLVLFRAVLLLVWNRLIFLVLTRAERTHATAMATIEGLDSLPDLNRPFLVMISSTLEDLAQERAAADRAITSLHLARFRFETFGSLAFTPRAVCEYMARQCDLLLVIIGERYGHVVQPENISVVEFEYRVGRQADPSKILLYVKHVQRTDGRLLHFLAEVEDFSHGYFRSSFETPEQLYERIHIDIARWLALRAR